MSIVHTVTGYDKRTERAAIEHVVPDEAFDDVRGLAGVPETDRDAIGSYPLDARAAWAIATRLAASMNVDRYDWVLEPHVAC